MSEPSTPSVGSSPFAVLTRKVGPLPGWAWLAIAIGGYAVYKMYQGRSSGPVTPAAGASPDASSLPVSEDPSTVNGGVGSGSVSTGIGPTNTTPVGPITNNQWAAVAARILISANPAQATVITNALQKYITQNKAGLNSAERSIVNQAIAQLGPPPEGLLPITASASPAKPPVHKPPVHKPVPTPPKFRSYTTKKGDTFRSISIKMYGQIGGGDDIKAANPSLAHYSVTAKLPSGHVLRIPVSARIGLK